MRWIWRMFVKFARLAFLTFRFDRAWMNSRLNTNSIFFFKKILVLAIESNL